MFNKKLAIVILSAALTFTLSSVAFAIDEGTYAAVQGNNTASTQYITGQDKTGRFIIKASGGTADARLYEKCTYNWSQIESLSATQESTTGYAKKSKDVYLKNGCTYKADLYGSGSVSAGVELFNY
ncbi:hypothetical protein PC41400_14350 [Paenibacillus chitinolyticus]|uniref:Uncharacterized protein n=1 Tax=Paenibacillus chitinolyticus TaxID=79263 RepID=A0A410WWD0_9BACL|nr:hypothetical protein [Paenibacillus chitinolyticus]MCY9591450.1 hypothetical protein [Paenibacillus chitinolyticus]MCY9598576.1 hypothetical protein [Paenibacillus chitinolyticus]QAV18796.1 hypothetical protein PC41400_14350 [Paenibacillus chitinolyticus]